MDYHLDAPLGLCRGRASFSNQADLMVEFNIWSDSFSWMPVVVVLG